MSYPIHPHGPGQVIRGLETLIRLAFLNDLVTFRWNDTWHRPVPILRNLADREFSDQGINVDTFNKPLLGAMASQGQLISAMLSQWPTAAVLIGSAAFGLPYSHELFIFVPAATATSAISATSPYTQEMIDLITTPRSIATPNECELNGRVRSCLKVEVKTDTLVAVVDATDKDSDQEPTRIRWDDKAATPLIAHVIPTTTMSSDGKSGPFSDVSNFAKIVGRASGLALWYTGVRALLGELETLPLIGMTKL